MLSRASPSRHLCLYLAKVVGLCERARREGVQARVCVCVRLCVSVRECACVCAYSVPVRVEVCMCARHAVPPLSYLNLVAFVMRAVCTSTS